MHAQINVGHIFSYGQFKALEILVFWGEREREWCTWPCICSLHPKKKSFFMSFNLKFGSRGQWRFLISFYFWIPNEKWRFEHSPSPPQLKNNVQKVSGEKSERRKGWQFYSFKKGKNFFIWQKKTCLRCFWRKANKCAPFAQTFHILKDSLITAIS